MKVLSNPLTIFALYISELRIFRPWKYLTEYVKFMYPGNWPKNLKWHWITFDVRRAQLFQVYRTQGLGFGLSNILAPMRPPLVWAYGEGKFFASLNVRLFDQCRVNDWIIGGTDDDRHPATDGEDGSESLRPVVFLKIQVNIGTGFGQRRMDFFRRFLGKPRLARVKPF